MSAKPIEMKRLDYRDGRYRIRMSADTIRNRWRHSAVVVVDGAAAVVVVAGLPG